MARPAHSVYLVVVDNLLYIEGRRFWRNADAGVGLMGKSLCALPISQSICVLRALSGTPGGHTFAFLLCSTNVSGKRKTSGLAQ